MMFYDSFWESSFELIDFVNEVGFCNSGCYCSRFNGKTIKFISSPPSPCGLLEDILELDILVL